MAEVPKIFPQSEEDDVFDEFDPLDDIALVDSEVEEPTPYGFTWAYDFNKEDLDFSNGDPPRTSGTGTVNQWILHSLNTEKFETPVLGQDIGTAVFSLLGEAIDSYTVSRVRQEILEATQAHDRIEEVEYISAFSVKNNLYAYVSYITDDGTDGQTLIQLR